LLALSVIAAVRDMGLFVPDDVSVVGFDGIAIGHMVTPVLATVDTPTEMMGSAAMNRLLRLIDGAPVPPGIELLPHRIRAGGTLAAAPRDAPTPSNATPDFRSLQSGDSHA
jgi:DNA-binding LacI/PurR family transcriptional regulator